MSFLYLALAAAYFWGAHAEIMKLRTISEDAARHGVLATIYMLISVNAFLYPIH